MTDQEILRLIGRNIQKARLARNLTQECLAEMVQLHWKTLGYIEAGQHAFGVVTFARLVQCLNVSPNRLLDGLSPANPDRMRQIAKALARKRRTPHT